MGAATGDGGALAGRALDREAAAYLGRAAAHRLEPEVAGVVGGGVEALPVVPDLEDDVLRAGVHPQTPCLRRRA